MSNEKAIDNNSTFNSDSPIESPEQDIFKRVPFAQGIAKVITNRVNPDSIVFGFYGEWGTGKTSVLNLIENELKKSKKIQCVKFNPWRFEDESSLILCFFESLSVALNKAIGSKKEKVGKLLVEWGELLVNINKKAGAFIKIGKKLSSVTLEQKMERLKGILREEGQEGRRIVVFIDDIDRLDKNEIQAVFKLVKLTANLPSIIYVLAFDDKMVAAALNEKYASDDFDLKEKYSSGNSESGRNFLEKIVQIPLRLPVIDDLSLTNFCLKQIETALSDSSIILPDKQIKDFERNFFHWYGKSLRTPRLCIKYYNRLSFVLPLLKGEINTVDLLLIEGINVFFPALFNKIIDNRELFVGNEFITDQVIESMEGLTEAGKEKIMGKNEKLFNDCIKGVPEKDIERVKELLKHLFPKSEYNILKFQLLGGFEDQWIKEQKIASHIYFDRYLQYTVPDYDISESKIKAFLSYIQDKSINENAKYWANLVTPENETNVFKQLFFKIDSMSECELTKLSEVIAKTTSLKSNAAPYLDDPDPTGFVYHLLLQLPGEKRFTPTLKILEIASSLIFSVYLFWKLGKPGGKPEETNNFSKKEETTLGEFLANKIKHEADNCILYKDRKYIGHIYKILHIWHKYLNKNEVWKYLHGTFERDSQNVTKFLASFWATVTDQMGFLTEIEVDKKIIYSGLKKIYGDDLENPDSVIGLDPEKDIEKWAAFDFAKKYHRMQTEKDKEED